MPGKRIVLTGGGTGGHITPLIAVAAELKKQNPDNYIIYIGERNAKYKSMATSHNFDEYHSIFAGKFRRYHGESWFTRIISVKTNLLNLRDLLYFAIGTLQCIVLVPRLKADNILLKGGFVGVPVGLASAFWHKKFITHDSDTVPGLANRLVGRWAYMHATGMPAEYYNYPAAKMQYIGVLVGEQYQQVTRQAQADFKAQLGLPKDAFVVLATGGSGGAASINTAVRAIAPELFQKYPNLHIVHQVGKGKGSVYSDYSSPRLNVVELLYPMYVNTGAADIVITRAGANTIAELGTQAKACIVVPNPLLTGGHQTKNTQVLAANSAAVVVEELLLKSDPSALTVAIDKLYTDPQLREQTANNLHNLTVSGASAKLAALLLNAQTGE